LIIKIKLTETEQCFFLRTNIWFFAVILARNHDNGFLCPSNNRKSGK
jgi:hypothetical protein